MRHLKRTAVAVELIVLSYLLFLLAKGILPAGAERWAGGVWKTALSPFGLRELPARLPVFFVAFPLGPPLAFVSNKKHGPEEASDRVIERYGSEVERLLFRAMNKT